MPVTIANVKKQRVGSRYVTYADITGPASYTTGGETLTAAQQAQLLPEEGAPAAVAMSKAEFFTSDTDITGRRLVLDRTNNKMLFWAATGAQEAGAANLSAVTIKCRIEYGAGIPG